MQWVTGIIMCKSHKCKFFDKKALTNVELSSKITLDNSGIGVPLCKKIIKKYFFRKEIRYELGRIDGSMGKLYDFYG